MISTQDGSYYLAHVELTSHVRSCNRPDSGLPLLLSLGLRLRLNSKSAVAHASSHSER